MKPRLKLVKPDAKTEQLHQHDWRIANIVAVNT